MLAHIRGWSASPAVACAPPSVAHIAMTKIKEGQSWGIPSVMRRSQEYPERLGAAVVAAWAARPALLALGDSAAPVAPPEPVQPARARPVPRRVRLGAGGRLVRTAQMRRHFEGRRSGAAADSEDVLSVDSQSEPALLGDSESEQDLFGELDLLGGGGGISADVSDGRAADVVDDDSDAALFSE